MKRILIGLMLAGVRRRNGSADCHATTAVAAAATAATAAAATHHREAGGSDARRMS